jgi:hypothetical protein
MKIVKSPDDAAARTNCVFVANTDFPTSTKYVLIDERIPFSTM